MRSGSCPSSPSGWLRLGTPDGRRRLERAPLARAAALRHELREARAARRPPVAVSVARSPGHQVLACPALGRRSGEAGTPRALLLRRALGADGAAGRRVPVPAHDGTTIRVL